MALRIQSSSPPSGGAEGSYAGGIANRFGMQAVSDFYLYMAMAGAAYQVRAGTITTPLIGKVVITDTAAEMCADCVLGTTIIPVRFNVGFRLLTGTLHEGGVKSVGTVSSAGTAFVPLPIRTNGVAAVTTARVQAAGAVTVTAELATTTLRHFEWANPAAGATGALPTSLYALSWEPRMPAILVGPRCVYVQISATTTGPSYYATLEYIEGLSSNLT